MTDLGAEPSGDTDLDHEDPAEAGPRPNPLLHHDDPHGLGWVASHPLGQVLVSLMAVFLVFFLFIWNLPDSEIRRKALPRISGTVYALAIDQNWGVFSPNPTTTSIRVEADVYLADGSVLRHVFPEGDNFLGGLREYRWRKWERRVRLDDNSRMWLPTASWVARQYDDRDPVRVVLIRYFSETPPPGSGVDRIWNSFEFYDYLVP